MPVLKAWTFLRLKPIHAWFLPFLIFIALGLIWLANIVRRLCPSTVEENTFATLSLDCFCLVGRTWWLGATTRHMVPPCCFHFFHALLKGSLWPCMTTHDHSHTCLMFFHQKRHLAQVTQGCLFLKMRHVLQQHGEPWVWENCNFTKARIYVNFAYSENLGKFVAFTFYISI